MTQALRQDAKAGNEWETTRPTERPAWGVWRLHGSDHEEFVHLTPGRCGRETSRGEDEGVDSPVQFLAAQRAQGHAELRVKY